MAFYLTDDGTLDTVVKCDNCGEELRYNYANDDDTCPHIEGIADACDECYDAFVKWAIADAEESHECVDDEPTEPEEGDITTEDHRTFYQYGKIVIQPYDKRDDDPTTWIMFPTSNRLQKIVTAPGHVAALRRFMGLSQFWPNVWFISDHGNAHLITVSESE